MRRQCDYSGTDRGIDEIAQTVHKVASDERPTPVATLLRGRRETLIEHAGQIYRLQVTRNNKLILTK